MTVERDKIAQFDGWLTGFKSARSGTWDISFGLESIFKDDAWAVTNDEGLELTIVVYSKRYVPDAVPVIDDELAAHLDAQEATEGVAPVIQIAPAAPDTPTPTATDTPGPLSPAQIIARAHARIQPAPPVPRIQPKETP